MTEKLERWRSNAPRWISALERGLNQRGENDLVVPYEQVALAFPSPEPNPLSFDSPLIEHNQLNQWASTQGWQIRSAPEMAPEGSDVSHPPVRFTKQV